MKAISFIFFAFIICNTLFAQNNTPDLKTKKREILYVVKVKGSKTEIKTANLIIDPFNITDLNVISIEDALKHYKVAEGTTVLITTVNPSVQLLTAKKLFTKYSLLDKMKYPVQIDGYFIKDPKNILAEVAAIESVRFNTSGKFIEIKSKQYVKNVQRGLPGKSQ